MATATKRKAWKPTETEKAEQRLFRYLERHRPQVKDPRVAVLFISNLLQIGGTRNEWDMLDLFCAFRRYDEETIQDVLATGFVRRVVNKKDGERYLKINMDTMDEAMPGIVRDWPKYWE